MRGALDCVSAKISPTESTEVFTIHSYSYSAPDLSDKTRDAESQSGSKTTSCQRCCWRFLIDLPLLLIVLSVLVIFEIGLIPSNKYGFYCNDPALSHPFTGDTVSTTMLIAGVLLLPIVIFFITELVTTSRSDSRLWTSFTSSLRLLRNYMFGLLAMTCVLQLMKGLVGEPRPVFFALCEPDAARTCKGNEFVSQFECTSEYSMMTRIDSYRSFPSGHAAFSIYCALYVAWYLQLRAFSWRNRSVLLVPITQLCVISFAAITALTRITDHRHHWWDVLAGSVIALCSVVYARRDVEDQREASPDSGLRSKHSYWWLCVDVPLLVIVLLLNGLNEQGVIPSNKSGFYCNDPALSFPYRGDTVTAGMLFTGLLIMPFLIFISSECALSSTPRKFQQNIFKNSCWLYRSYIYGLLMNFSIVELMKGIFGGPRPIFFDLCKPDKGLTCNGTEYVSTFQCTSNYTWWQQMDSSRSFPSGHTSLSVYCGLFLAWYLQMRAFNWRSRSITLVPFIQLCVLSFSVVSSLTRITDHCHHWWDVLTGSVIGFIVFVYAVICLCNNFSTPSERKSLKTEANNVVAHQNLLPRNYQYY